MNHLLLKISVMMALAAPALAAEPTRTAPPQMLPPTESLFQKVQRSCMYKEERVSGKLVGFRVHHLQSGGFCEEVGLKNDDVVPKTEDERPGAVVTQVYRRLISYAKGENDFSMNVIRDGQTILVTKAKKSVPAQEVAK